MKISKEIEAYINETSKKTADSVVHNLKSNRLLKTNFSFYKRTELLLYNYEKLKLAVQQKQEDIDYIEENGLPEKSKSITFYSSGGGNISAGDRYLELIEKYRVEKVETERDVQRIESAIDKVKDDKYYKIIELKYLNQECKTDEEMAETLKKDQSTITRNRNRLINSLKTILFPESIKELL